MFCQNCGNELKEGTLFCGKCGTKQNNFMTDISSNINLNATVLKKKHKKLPFIIIGVAVILIVFAVIVFVGNSSEFSVAAVKEGHLPYFSNYTTIGEAFSDSFHNGKWEYDDDDEDDNEQYVFFNGYCYSANGDKIDIKIAFLYDSDKHDSDEFEVYAIELENEYGDEVGFTDADDIEGFFNWVFNGDDFAWQWDNYDYNDDWDW